MSHFSLAVFHRKDQSIDELLEPYNENIPVEPYVRFTRQEAIDYARKNYGAELMPDEECWKMVAEGCETDSDGNIYSTYNENSRWDWWEIGGRWRGSLRNHGRKVDSGRIDDLDFRIDKKVYDECLRFWDVEVEHEPAKAGESYFPFYNENYLRECYGDRETYARLNAQFSTFAVLLPDGSWHEKGHLGWFGFSGETAEEARNWLESYKPRFLDTADPDWYLTVVDCHI